MAIPASRQQGASFLTELYASWLARMNSNPNYDVADLRDIFEAWHRPTFECEGVSYRSDLIADVPVLRATPAGADPASVILYYHGGGFVVGSTDSHRKLAGHLAHHLGMAAILVDYRLAPEHPFPAAIEDAVTVYRSLLAEGIEPRNILSAGDSAGGNLAIASVLKMRANKLPLPAAIIAFSPWLDMEHVGETLTTNDASDALVKKSVLEGMSALYLSEVSRTEPLANPLKADLAGLPPVYVNVGSEETLLDNATGFAALAHAAGVNVTLSVVPGMQHVFPCLAGRAGEADEELSRIAAWRAGLITASTHSFTDL